MGQAKKTSADNTKTINAIEKDDFMWFFKVSENVYDAAMSQVNGETLSKILGNSSDWLPSLYTPGSYLNVGSKSAGVYTINKGKERATTFKIDTGGYVFSCLFD